MDQRVMVILAEGFEEGKPLPSSMYCGGRGLKPMRSALPGSWSPAPTGMRLMADRILDSEGFRDYDMIVLPGGWGAADNMAADSRLTELLRWYAAQPEKYVAAMCAAPGVLAKAGITAGKTVTSYPGPKLEPLFEDARYITDTVAFDDHLITSRGPATALPFAFCAGGSAGRGQRLYQGSFPLPGTQGIQ